MDDGHPIIRIVIFIILLVINAAFTGTEVAVSAVNESVLPASPTLAGGLYIAGCSLIKKFRGNIGTKRKQKLLPCNHRKAVVRFTQIV